MGFLLMMGGSALVAAGVISQGFGWFVIGAGLVTFIFGGYKEG